MNSTKSVSAVLTVSFALFTGFLERGWAFRASDTPSTPNFDKRRDGLPTLQITPERQKAAAQLQARLPGVRIDFDQITGAPAWISTLGFLSRSTEEEIQRTGDVGLAQDDPHRAIKAFLIENSGVFGHGPEALTNSAIIREFVTEHNGMRIVAWQQHLDGILVFQAVLKAQITKRGELVNISSMFLPDIQRASGLDHSSRLRLESAPAVPAAQALAYALTNLGERVAIDALVPGSADSIAVDKRQTFTAAPLLGEAHSSLVWLPMSRSVVRLCWLVEFIHRSPMEGFRFLVDAVSGEVLVRENRTCNYSDASYRIFPSDSPSPFSPGHAVPSSTQPTVVTRQFATLPALSQTASPQGWIRDYDNLTLGNNVDASANRNGQIPNPTPRPQGSPFRVFDFSLDLNQDPSTYADAAAVSLFYWCNWMHDRLYGLGFTEAAGNFQDDNFGRGGVPGDRVLAYAQFGANLGYADNASFFPAPDGTSGMIQMYIWDYPYPNRDGDLDAEVMLHEYTHGLSDRLVGINYAQYDRQDAGLAEGWSDFYALSLLSEAGDDVYASYPMGGYVAYLLGGLTENYYYGIRRYPYSTDITKNPLTFKDVDPGQADPHSGIPTSSVVGGWPSEVHNQGEVWCVTLWEARANLITRHGYAVGNELILQLVTDGMNLCPPNPTFIQARDAILQADAVNTGGENQYDLWRAFAKRGMGWGATAPESYWTYGIVENFDMPPVVQVNPVQWVFPPYVDESFPYTLIFRISRTGPTTSALNFVTFLMGGDQFGTQWTDAEWPYDFTVSGCNKAPFPNAFYMSIPAGQDHVDVSLNIVNDDETEYPYERVSPRLLFVPTSSGYVVGPGESELPLYIADND